MRTIKVDGMTLSSKDDSLMLSQPWNDNNCYLTEFGAIRDGDMQIKRFPLSRFHTNPKAIEEGVKRFKEQVDFVSGMSGFSSLDQKRCNDLDIRLGQYENSVMGIMTSAINRVRARMAKIRYGLVYGSSAMGVDLAIETVAMAQNIPLIGFTCLEYLWYVDSRIEGPQIYVLPTKEDYCHAYVGSCDLLMASNGGEVSYDKDIIAATKMRIPVLPIDVIGMLGASIPAFKPDGSINDAVGALLHVMRLISFGGVGQGLAEDRYQIVANQFADAVTARAREVVPPAYAFEPLAA